MKFRNSTNSYGVITRWLHWILALLILFQYIYIYTREYLVNEKSPTAYQLLVHFHKPFGLIILVGVTFFILWKSLNKHPHFPKSMSRWERVAAQITHWVLLLLTLIMALSGLIMSMAAGYPPSFFDLYTLPPFIAKNAPIAHQFSEIHETCGVLLIILISIHFLAALKHHFIDKDNILKRIKL